MDGSVMTKISSLLQ